MKGEAQHEGTDCLTSTSSNPTLCLGCVLGKGWDEVYFLPASVCLYVSGWMSSKVVFNLFEG